MAGGERERKGKRKESRFSDRPRPKPSKAEKQAAALKREGFDMVASKGTYFKYCPVDGQRLQGSRCVCPKCKEEYGGKLIFERGASVNAVLVDAREYLAMWRRKMFWRMLPPFHSGVVWTTGPPVPVAAFDTIFDKDWQVDAYVTSVRKIIKQLETTRAVEDFCGFENVDEARGWKAGKVLPSGSLLYMVPPVDVVHTESRASGSKVCFTYGWVILTTKGNIVRAEGMETPAEGWQHVEARVRDLAADMLDCGLEVSPEMVSISEAKLLEQYGGDEDKFALSRIARADDDAHVIWPRDTIQSKALIRSPVKYEGPKTSFAAEPERTAEEEAVLYPLYRQVFARDIGTDGHAAEVAGRLRPLPLLPLPPLPLPAPEPLLLFAPTPLPFPDPDGTAAVVWGSLIPSTADVGAVPLTAPPGRKFSAAVLDAVLKGKPIPTEGVFDELL